MAITPNDILEKQFNNKFRGYDPEQVNDYLDLVRVELEKTLDENHNLSRDLAEANDKIAYFSQLQESLNSSIIIAQEAAERLKQNARKEAELILYEAESEANRVIKEANDQSSGLFEEAEKLRIATQDYRKEMRRLIQGQLDIIDNESFERLFEGTVLTPAKAKTKEDITSSRVNALVDQADQEMQEGFDAIPKSQDAYQNQDPHRFDPEPNLAPDPLFLQATQEEEDVEVTQVFNLKELRALENANFADEQDSEDNFDIPLSREELEAHNHSFDEDEADFDEEDLHGHLKQVDLPTED